VSVRFIDIGGIVDHHCLTFFSLFCQKEEKKLLNSKRKERLTNRNIKDRIFPIKYIK